MLTGKKKDMHRMNIWQSALDTEFQKDGVPTNLYAMASGNAERGLPSSLLLVKLLATGI